MCLRIMCTMIVGQMQLNRRSCTYCTVDGSTGVRLSETDGAQLIKKILETGRFFPNVLETLVLTTTRSARLAVGDRDQGWELDS
jgi:hypothetical protein